jgi:hypothetical protein
MDLDSLANVDRPTARRIVASALAALLAGESASQAKPIETLPEREQGVIREWAFKAKVDPYSLDRKSRLKLLELANEALITIVTGDTKPKDMQNKLGAAGVLAPDRYTPVPTATLKESLGLSGLSARDAENAVRNADAYQHLFPPDDFGPDADFLSIFVRLLNKSDVQSKRSPAQWLLVTGSRKGKTIEMQTAFLILETKIEIDPIRSTPVDLLKSFANTFGNEITLGGTSVGKFCLYKTLPGHELPPVGVSGRRVLASLMFRFNSKRNVTEIATAFSIDKDRYEASLRDDRSTQKVT